MINIRKARVIFKVLSMQNTILITYKDNVVNLLWLPIPTKYFFCVLTQLWPQNMKYYYRLSSTIGRWNALSMLMWTGKVLLKSTMGSMSAGSVEASWHRFGNVVAASASTTLSLSSACHAQWQDDSYIDCIQHINVQNVTVHSFHNHLLYV